jgi:hypothetical protein
MEAQNFEIYTTPKLHKTHQSYLAYERHTDGNEIHFAKVTPIDHKTTRSVLLRDEQKFLKMKQYQKRIIALGLAINSSSPSKDKITMLDNEYLVPRYLHTKS